VPGSDESLELVSRYLAALVQFATVSKEEIETGLHHCQCWQNRDKNKVNALLMYSLRLRYFYFSFPSGYLYMIQRDRQKQYWMVQCRVGVSNKIIGREHRREWQPPTRAPTCRH
jgi:hypothetical protein